MFQERQNVITETLNTHSQSFQIIDRKLNGLFNYLKTGPSTITPTSGVTPAREELEQEDNVRKIIKRMSSSIPQIRAKTNYLQCLDVMGFPVTTSVEDVSDIIVLYML